MKYFKQSDPTGAFYDPASQVTIAGPEVIKLEDSQVTNGIYSQVAKGRLLVSNITEYNSYISAKEEGTLQAYVVKATKDALEDPTGRNQPGIIHAELPAVPPNIHTNPHKVYRLVNVVTGTPEADKEGLLFYSDGGKVHYRAPLQDEVYVNLTTNKIYRVTGQLPYLTWSEVPTLPTIPSTPPVPNSAVIYSGTFSDFTFDNSLSSVTADSVALLVSGSEVVSQDQYELNTTGKKLIDLGVADPFIQVTIYIFNL